MHLRSFFVSLRGQVSRATQSRASNLAESTGRIERLTGREAALPSRPPPPPRTGEEPDAAAAAQMVLAPSPALLSGLLD